MMRAGPIEGARPVYDDRDICPVACRALFVAVIGEALHMVETGVPAGGHGRSDANMRRERDAALAWFGTEIFEAYCGFADIEPDVVRGHLARIVAGEATMARKRMRITRRARA